MFGSILPTCRRLYRPPVVLEILLQDIIHNVIPLILFCAIHEFHLAFFFLNDLDHLGITVFESSCLLTYLHHVIGNFLFCQITGQ